ncbi:MAG: FAD-dependent oxidoreductase [Candidatus Omnitrophica bacterium]|nr:FAD-dependent oxidoreductase [Candidatus Omnitrophota bacterium]
MKEGICILGAGCAGLSLTKTLRNSGADPKVILIDKNKYFFDRKYLSRLFIRKNKEEVINLEGFSKKFNLEFINKEAERINLSKKMVYFKDKTSLEFDRLVISTGLISKKLSIPGDFREKCFYLADIDLFRAFDYLKVSKHIVILAFTILGLKLAFYLSFLDKEVKLLTGDLSFLGENKQSIFSVLTDRGIDIYEDTMITEIIGDSMVKAVKTSIPKIFAAGVIFIDSGFSPDTKLLVSPLGQDNLSGLYPDVYSLGDLKTKNIEKELFFIFNNLNAEMEGVALGECFLGEKDFNFIPKIYTEEDVKSFLKEEFDEEKLLLRR